MSDVKTNQFGGALLFILGEFAVAEEEMFEDGGMEVFGEDDQGREGSCEISINELAQAAYDEIKHLRQRIATLDRINKEFGQVLSPVYEYCETNIQTQLGKSITESLIESHKTLAREAIEVAKAQEDFVMARIAEAFEKAQIPKHAKAGCIGEFEFTIEDDVCCPECWEEQSNDCQLCNGESNESGLSDLTATVPWDLCKEIWLRMNRIYAEELREGEYK